MPKAVINGVGLFYEEAGQGAPIVFVHEFGGDVRSWDLQLRFFAQRYHAIAFGARGYPPSDVPDDPAAYSQDLAADDIRGILDHLGLPRAHVCGLSMGAYATLHFGLRYPERALSLVVAGCGSGSAGDLDGFRRDCLVVAEKLERDGMAAVAEFYLRGPTRVQFLEKDPKGWQEYRARFAQQSAMGHALTLRRVVLNRPTIFELGERLGQVPVPTLLIAGDEDDPCLEASVFMKRKIPSAGLLVIPRAGHTINLEEPDVFNRAVLDFITAAESGGWRPRNPQSQTGSAILPADVGVRR